MIKMASGMLASSAVARRKCAALNLLDSASVPLVFLHRRAVQKVAIAQITQANSLQLYHIAVHKPKLCICSLWATILVSHFSYVLL